MPGKRLMQGWVLLALLGTTGCCAWCRRHCGMDAVACQPACCVPCCAPAQQACQPATTYQAPPAAYAPPAPAPAQATWQRYYPPANCNCP